MTMKCIFKMKWFKILHKMMWNVRNAWNATWSAWNAIHWFRLHATWCNLDFDFGHNLIILFLISLRIWTLMLMWNWLNRMSKIFVYIGFLPYVDHVTYHLIHYNYYVVKLGSSSWVRIWMWLTPPHLLIVLRDFLLVVGLECVRMTL